MKNILKAVIKKAWQEESVKRFHLMHQKEADKILNVLKIENGKLNPKFHKLSKEYAQDVFGNKYFAPWLHVYSEIAGVFKEGWIPDNYYGLYVVPYKSSFFGILNSGVKTLTMKLLNTKRLPDIAYYVSGLFFTTTWEVIPADDIKKYLFHHHDKVVYKEDTSFQGKGIHIFTKETFDIVKIRAIGNGVFQSYIKQHGFFDEIMPDAVATLRLTSVIEDTGKASCRAAIMRFGRKNDLYCKWTADIKIPVDVQTGQINEKGYLPDWRTVNCHPDTHVAFQGKVIPKFQDCVEMALHMHQIIPFTRSIGWDLIVNEKEEIQLMELNGGNNDIKFSEATQGPCFADMGWENLWKGC